MKIAAIQMNCKPGDVSTNLMEMSRQVRAAAATGAKLIVLPEMADTGYDMSLMPSCADGTVARQALGELARELGVYLVAGLSLKEGGKLFNTAVAFGSDGKVLAEYRKVHLFASAPIHEDRLFTAGDSLAIFEIGQWVCGLMICYDVRFPELARSLALKGVNLLIVPTAWPTPRIAHWQALTAARAIENQAYLIGANRVGTDAQVTFGGSSTIVDPQGQLQRAGETPATVVAEISIERVSEFRQMIPCLSHRRAAVYKH